MQKLALVVVAVIIIGGGYWWYSNQQAPAEVAVDNSMTLGDANMQTSSDTGTQVGVDVNVSVPKTVTIAFNGDAFDPKSVTINKGDTVKWVSAGSNMWVASAQHPDHVVYSGTTRAQHCPDTSGSSFDQCAPGTSYSFTFNKTGTWNYHDHLNSQLFGSVIVQ